jgi:hypothetical protein
MKQCDNKSCDKEAKVILENVAVCEECFTNGMNKLLAVAKADTFYDEYVRGE